MKLKISIVFLFVLLIWAIPYCCGGEIVDIDVELSDPRSLESNGKGLRIYLPREVQVNDDFIELASVGIIRGDRALVSKAGSIGLGKFAVTGQQIIIDRVTILSRLASAGINSHEVVFTGVEKVKVRRDEEVISGERFSEVARSFLMTQIDTASVVQINLVGKQKDWILPKGTGEVKLVPKMNRYSTKSKAKVWVSVMQEGTEIGGYEVAFNLKYKCRKAVALVDIRAGIMISSDNVKIVTEEVSLPEPSDWSAPYGLVAKRNIRKGDIVHINTVGPVEPTVIIKRKQMVVVKIETPGLTVSSLGEALSDGKVGEYIKVRMGMNRNARQIVAQVKPNGIVVPVY